jgi:hypothetical protein
MSAFKLFILSCLVVLAQEIPVELVRADLPAGFPAAHCDCVIELDSAAPLLENQGFDHALIDMMGLIGGGEVERLLGEPALRIPGTLHDCLISGSSIGARATEDSDEIEWVVWIDPPRGHQDDLRKVIQQLSPVRGLGGLVVPDLGISLVELNGGLLLCSEPPGKLRELAIKGISSGIGSKRRPARKAIDRDAPLIVTFTHDEPLGGNSCLAASRVQETLEIEYRGRFKDGPLVPPGVKRRLDIEVLERLPEDVILAVVEHSDADIIPGEDVIFRLLPYLADPELPDERRSRRLVVVSEAPQDPGLPDDLRMPALAVAIEVDGPGASSRRQDLKVLASLNNLRNRLGGRAGLQHLPKPDSFPEDGTRTIFTRALFDAALEGHPLARCVSVNWCQTAGDTCWQLYATTPELAEAVASSLEASSDDVSCLAASHAGRLDADRAVQHLVSWLSMGGVFAGNDRASEFSIGIKSLSGAMESFSSIEWSITIPDRNEVDALIRLQPAVSGETGR